MAPIPIDPRNLTSLEIARKLKEKGYTSGYYVALQEELDSRMERSRAIEKLETEKVKAKARVKPKPKHTLDKKSVEHTVKNTVGVGTLAGGGVVVREALAVYDELKSRGIAPTEEAIINTIQAQGWSDEAKVYFWSAVIITALITLGWKFFKEYK